MPVGGGVGFKFTEWRHGGTARDVLEGSYTVGGRGGTRPLLSGWLILYQGGGGGSEAKKKFVYLKSTSEFGPL